MGCNDIITRYMLQRGKKEKDGKKKIERRQNISSFLVHHELDT